MDSFNKKRVFSDKAIKAVRFGLPILFFLVLVLSLLYIFNEKIEADRAAYTIAINFLPYCEDPKVTGAVGDRCTEYRQYVQNYPFVHALVDTCADVLGRAGGVLRVISFFSTVQGTALLLAAMLVAYRILLNEQKLNGDLLDICTRYPPTKYKTWAERNTADI